VKEGKEETFNVWDGSLDVFILHTCDELGIEYDGDVFAQVFSGKERFSEDEAKELIKKGADTYKLWK